MHTVHHLGASNSTIYYHHYSQLGRVADGSSAMPSLTRGGHMGPGGQHWLFVWACCGAQEGT
jgi:hypothetical protein